MAANSNPMTKNTIYSNIVIMKKEPRSLSKRQASQSGQNSNRITPARVLIAIVSNSEAKGMMNIATILCQRFGLR